MEQQNNSGLGKVMLFFAAALAAMTWFFNEALDQQHNPNRHLDTQRGGADEVVLQQNRQGQYLASGSINGEAVDFLVDTGATNVAIPKPIADKLGLKAETETLASTANGIINVGVTRLAKVQLGAITLRDIRANITSGMSADDEILLGMSFLRQLEITQRDKMLILKPMP